jgi:hypothetical protein
MSDVNIIFEEDIEQIVTAIEKFLGKSGRMLPSGLTVTYNNVLKVMGHEVWYGDIDLEVDENALALATQEIGHTVHVVSENYRFE